MNNGHGGARLPTKFIGGEAKRNKPRCIDCNKWMRRNGMRCSRCSQIVANKRWRSQ